MGEWFVIDCLPSGRGRGKFSNADILEFDFLSRAVHLQSDRTGANERQVVGLRDGHTIDANLAVLALKMDL